jgi:hypothetical protein
MSTKCPTKEAEFSHHYLASERGEGDTFVSKPRDTLNKVTRKTKATNADTFERPITKKIKKQNLHQMTSRFVSVPRR